jgi:hypothetical protein
MQEWAKETVEDPVEKVTHMWEEEEEEEERRRKKRTLMWRLW